MPLRKIIVSECRYDDNYNHRQRGAGNRQIFNKDYICRDGNSRGNKVDIEKVSCFLNETYFKIKLLSHRRKKIIIHQYRHDHPGAVVARIKEHLEKLLAPERDKNSYQPDERHVNSLELNDPVSEILRFRLEVFHKYRVPYLLYRRANEPDYR